jgi:chitosanase
MHIKRRALWLSLRSAPSSTTWTVSLVVAAGFAVTGYVLLSHSSAATSSVSSEAESGQRSGNQALATEPGASGGSVVKFGSGGTTGGSDLATPSKKEIAMELVSSAENSSLDWKAQYKYIEDIGDGRGYTAGIIGFCSGTGDMLELVQYYDQVKPGNILQKYLSALQQVNGTASHTGLGTAFVNDWKTAAADTVFQQAQDHERDRVYFDPSVNQAKTDGLRALGQFIYYDAIVMHGPGSDSSSFGGLRAGVVKKTKPPSQGGDETVYLNAFLDARKTLMLTEAAHDDTSRVDTEQRLFLQAGNLDLNVPLNWKTYGDPYSITTNP